MSLPSNPSERKSSKPLSSQRKPRRPGGDEMARRTARARPLALRPGQSRLRRGQLSALCGGAPMAASSLPPAPPPPSGGQGTPAQRWGDPSLDDLLSGADIGTTFGRTCSSRCSRSTCLLALRFRRSGQLSAYVSLSAWLWTEFARFTNHGFGPATASLILGRLCHNCWASDPPLRV